MFAKKMTSIIHRFIYMNVGMNYEEYELTFIYFH